MERRLEPIRSDLLERTKSALRQRLRFVCIDWSPDEIEALVTRMASLEIKYSMRRRADFIRHEA